MIGTNIFRRLQELQPAPAVLIADVVAVNDDNTSTVQFQDGSQIRVRGTSVAVGQPAFIRNGIVEGLAPARTAIVIEI